MKLALFLLLAMTVMSAPARVAESKDRGVAGTYDVLICKGECSFTEHRNVLRTAVIVLFDRAMRRNDVAQIDPTYLDFRYGKATACYLLDYPNRQALGNRVDA